MPNDHEALTDPALPAGALATLDSGIRSGAAGGGRGPLSLARRLGGLTSVLMLAVVATLGFIGGVDVQKRQKVTTSVAASGTGATGGAGAGSARAGGGSTTTTAPAANAPAEATPTTAGAAGAAPAGGGAGGARPRAGAGGAGAAPGGAAAGAAAAGQVKRVDGLNIFVTDAQGNEVKVVTTPSSRFTRTGPGSLQEVRPGDAVIVQGQKGDDGVVTATAVADSGGS
jgi:hypothetical protein